MSHRFLTSASISTMITFALLAPFPVAGQPASPPAEGVTKTWTTPRTPDGKPDLQGVWDYRTITPLERPVALGTKAFFTDEEAAKYEQQENGRQNRDLIDPKVGGLNYPANGVVPYNEFWYDRGNKVVGTKRTSLIVDPPNGRLPPTTPEGQAKAKRRAEIGREEQLGHPLADSWEDRPLSERCILGANSGPPMTPGAYNNNFQLFQTPDTVVIVNEMIHEARIVPMDGRPHLQRIRNGRETRAATGRATRSSSTPRISSARRAFRARAPTMHLTERFTRTGPDALLYEFTVDDPDTWTKPWTAAVPTSRIDVPVYEYACHEGNYAMIGILAGARADEKARADAGKNAAK